MGLNAEADEFFVISDLHLGGVSGRQIFDSTEELVWFLKHVAGLAAAAPDRRFLLLINGDFVDFLAEPQPTYFDAHGAVARLDRIFKDEPAFRGILAGLRTLVGTANCRLAVNLGNHDLELALPWVKAHFEAMITGGDAAAMGRLDILTDGTGFRVSVNGVQHYCAHGNEVDPWNVTDHEHIRRMARDILRGRPVDPWIPNAGTQLVIDAMNEIKADFAFVDVLKPETGAVVPILTALRPDLARKIADVYNVLRRLGIDKLRTRGGFLGDEDARAAAEAETFRQRRQVLGAQALQASSDRQARDLLDQADEGFRNHVSPMDMVASEEVSGQLGFWSRPKAAIKGVSLSEQVRSELQDLANDRSFDLGLPDASFAEFDGFAGPQIDVIVTGHTHMRRALRRRTSQGYYFNTGTWARVVEIDAAMLKDQARFDAFFAAVEEGSLAALDRLRGVVQRHTPVYSATASATGCQVQLNSVAKKGRTRSLEPVGGTVFQVEPSA